MVRWVVGIGWVIAAVVLALVCWPRNPPTPSVQSAQQTVQLSVVPPQGASLRFDLPWREGLTVLDALQAAAASTGGLPLKFRGQGEMAFVDSLAGVANEGRSGRNWEFWLNGDIGQLGVGAQPVRPGDSVLWKFEHFDYDRAAGEVGDGKSEMLKVKMKNEE